MTHAEFEHIATRLHSQMLKVALDFFTAREDAEDAVQDAMVQLWRYCEHINAKQNVTGLAVRVAKNCCVNLYRKQQAQRASHYDEGTEPITRQQPDSAPTPLERLEAEDAQVMLDEVVTLLKPRERQLFELRAIMGYSNDDIAIHTGIPKASVVAMVSTARKKVMTELKRRMRR